MSFALALVLGQLVMPNLARNGLAFASRHETGNVSLSLFVDQEGRVVECEVLHASHDNERLRARLCRDAIGRDIGDGAIGQGGERVHGTITVGRMVTGEALPSPVDNIEMELSVNSLPAAATHLRVYLLAQRDENGRITACEPQPHSNADYGAIACGQAMGQVFEARTGADGQPVPYVAPLTALFTLDSFDGRTQ